MDRCIRIRPRLYSIRDENGERRTPTVIEIARQYIRSLDFIADRRCLPRALDEAFHLATFAGFVIHLVYWAKWWSMLAMGGFMVALGTIGNTLWYHRYCAHQAFRFSHPAFVRCFLWFNPMGIHEEAYVLMHHIHHDVADQDEDPYGPHLGPLGSYFESATFDIDADVTPREYARIKNRLAHVAIPFASLESFRKWRSVEWLPHYVVRMGFAAAFWTLVWHWLGGWALVGAWFGALFATTAVIRDFNYRGHAAHGTGRHVPGWDMNGSTGALNQRFYGYIASEWHNNHHSFRVSANTAFLPGQVDLAFLMIRAMHLLGIVTRYNDHKAQFEAKFVSRLRQMPAPGHARERSTP
jgi:stearoyl-CoA desaturase (delta-9 desaturase)